MLYHLHQKREFFSAQLRILADKLAELPEGKLIYSRCKDHTKWFKSNGSSPIYISKKERSLAEGLALRKYYTYQTEEITYRLNLIDNFLDQYLKCPDRASALLEESSCYKELLAKHFSQQDEEIRQWLDDDYPHNTRNPETCIHKCIPNLYVRSKSEVIIANSLFLNKIPYRYECELLLGDISIYPDFTILHPQTHQLFYWEHFGLMDKRPYRQSVANKLITYGDYGIYPSVNLITTYETASHPINSEKIEKLIQEYFL